MSQNPLQTVHPPAQPLLSTYAHRRQYVMKTTKKSYSLMNRTCPSVEPEVCERFEKYVAWAKLVDEPITYADVCVPHDTPYYDPDVPCEKAAIGPNWLWVLGWFGQHGWRSTQVMHHVLGVHRCYSKINCGFSHSGAGRRHQCIASQERKARCEVGRQSCRSCILRLAHFSDSSSPTLKSRLVTFGLCVASMPPASFPALNPSAAHVGRMAWLLARRMVDPQLLVLPKREDLLVQVRLRKGAMWCPISLGWMTHPRAFNSAGLSSSDPARLASLRSTLYLCAHSCPHSASQVPDKMWSRSFLYNTSAHTKYIVKKFVEEAVRLRKIPVFAPISCQAKWLDRSNLTESGTLDERVVETLEGAPRSMMLSCCCVSPPLSFWYQVQLQCG